ncbi:MAG: phosphatase PAP2 family protein [Myxococcota bacterium]
MIPQHAQRDRDLLLGPTVATRQAVEARSTLSEIVVAAFHVAVIALLLPWADTTAGVPTAITQSLAMVAGGVIVFVTAPRRPRIASWLRMALVTAACFVGYEQANVLVSIYHDGPDLEPWALAADRVLFGGQPSVWMAPLTHPVLTEVLQMAYVTYYVAPLILVAWLLGTRRGRAAGVVMLGVVLATHLNFVSYVLVPLRSPFLLVDDPAYAAALSYPNELQGLWLFESIRQGLLDATTMRHDCFPSGHTLLTTATLLLAWRVDRRAFAVLLPLTVAIVVSTIYLRYHYAIDVVVALVLAPIVARGAVVLHRRWTTQA